jgi:hypothetical protein
VNGYTRRTVDDELDELTAGLAAVALDGAKGVGKTTTAVQRARTVFRYDDATERTLVDADPGRLDRASPPLLLDEWQRHPVVWDLVRRRVDAGAEPGRFLLTGSATPIEAPTHSGAGRIARVRMRPMTLVERGSTPTVSLGRLLSGTRPAIRGESGFTLPDYVEEIARTGLPALRDLTPRLRRTQLEGYVTTVVERDFPDHGLLVRRPRVLRDWLTAYAAATATTASYKSILEAATAGESEKPAASTTRSYRDVLSHLWLLDPVPGWTPLGRPLSRLATNPKHHLLDPGLAAHLMGLDPPALLEGREVGPPAIRKGPLLGALFESLVTLCVRVYAQASECRVAHLRTRDGGHEVDLVVERSDRRVIGIEVKLGPTASDGDARHLTWLKDRLRDDLLDAIVVTTGPAAFRRHDGIAVVPAALLGP